MEHDLGVGAEKFQNSEHKDHPNDIALLYIVYTSLSKLPQSFTSGDDASTAGASNSQTPRQNPGIPPYSSKLSQQVSNSDGQHHFIVTTTSQGKVTLTNLSPLRNSKKLQNH